MSFKLFCCQLLRKGHFHPKKMMFALLNFLVKVYFTDQKLLDIKMYYRYLFVFLIF